MFSRFNVFEWLFWSMPVYLVFRWTHIWVFRKTRWRFRFFLWFSDSCCVSWKLWALGKPVLTPKKSSGDLGYRPQRNNPKDRTVKSHQVMCFNMCCLFVLRLLRIFFYNMWQQSTCLSLKPWALGSPSWCSLPKEKQTRLVQEMEVGRTQTWGPLKRFHGHGASF